MTEIFQLSVKDFTGPLDVLLKMIEEKKMHISDVSLSSVADEYLAFLRSQEKLPVGQIADFLVIAATLMLIKSVSLLPNLELKPEEEQGIEDLENRLRIYKAIKDREEIVKNLFGKKEIFFRDESGGWPEVFAPSADISTGGLLSSLQDLIRLLPKPEKLPEAVVEKIVSLEEVISDIASRISQAMSMKFKDYTDQFAGDKKSIIVSFLGLLELVKQGTVDANQGELFEDISFGKV